MIELPDVNVRLALFDGKHTHHLAAGHYWHEQSGSQTARLSGLDARISAPQHSAARAQPGAVP